MFMIVFMSYGACQRLLFYQPSDLGRNDGFWVISKDFGVIFLLTVCVELLRLTDKF